MDTSIVLKLNSMPLFKCLPDMSTIKRNFFYSSILTAANYVFPFLTYPYVSRVLGVSNIGICNFVDSIINYFVLFSAMGISIIGIREIAKVKNNQEQLSRTFSSLIILNFTTTIVLAFVLGLSIQFIPKFQEYRDLLYVGMFKLFGNLLLIEWFYKGLEDFKYITIRSIIVKCVYVLCVFLFVKNQADYIIYYALITSMTVINCIFNCIHSCQFVKFRLKNIAIKQYLSSFFVLGFYMVLTSMYTSFNVVYLGFQGGEIEVGYYTTATKIYTILLSVFTAFTGVMLPRMSSLLSEGKTDEFKNMLSKSVNILLYFSVPAIIMTEFFAPEIIQAISGKGYEGAIIPMRIVMPLILIIGYEQIIIIQGLMPLKKDKAITVNSILGAGTGLLLNIILVPFWDSVGSALVWIFSELVVATSACFFINKYVGIKFPFALIFKNLTYYIPFVVILSIFFYLGVSRMVLFMVSSVVCVIYFMILHLAIIKDSFVAIILHKYLIKLKK